EALRNIEPSAMREVFVEVPKVNWKDVGGLESAKQDLIEVVEWPIKYPEVFEDLDTKPPNGILLFGPPGTGKTLLVKAAANESEANFISIKGPELLSKWVGESEKALREVFRKAKQAAPCIIFFDEIDSIATVRGSSTDSNATERVVSQILTELDGMEELKDVIVIAATNRPDMVDNALLRPGRLDRLIYVKPPSEDEIEEIFKIHTKNKPIADNIDFKKIIPRVKGYVGADIAAICKEATITALREFIESGADDDEIRSNSKNIVIAREHFEGALERVKPTSSQDKIKEFEEVSEDFARYAYM
ncbi:MAG: AAA family ATPase, partial [Halobacteriota archaeon]|nr:AAA family ATPase [Halobacteriota archaeon]